MFKTFIILLTFISVVKADSDDEAPWLCPAGFSQEGDEPKYRYTTRDKTQFIFCGYIQDVLEKKYQYEAVEYGVYSVYQDEMKELFSLGAYPFGSRIYVAKNGELDHIALYANLWFMGNGQKQLEFEHITLNPLDAKRHYTLKTIPPLTLEHRRFVYELYNSYRDKDNVSIDRLLRKADDGLNDLVGLAALKGDSLALNLYRNLDKYFILDGGGADEYINSKSFFEGYLTHHRLQALKKDSDIIEVKASSVLIEKIDHSEPKLLDLDRKTAWFEGVEGNGVGESVSFTFATGQNLKSLTIYNGYGKSAKAFKENGRIKSFLVEYKSLDKKIITRQVALEDIRVAQYIDVNLKNIIGVRFEISDIYGGTKYSDVGFSDIEFFSARF